MPPAASLAAMANYNEALISAGVMVTGAGLKPSSAGVRVRFSGADRTVIDGPFAEISELVAGFWIWEVGSMREAIEWVKRCPNRQISGSEIEIRQIYGPEDFAAVSTSEIDA